MPRIPTQLLSLPYLVPIARSKCPSADERDRSEVFATSQHNIANRPRFLPFASDDDDERDVDFPCHPPMRVAPIQKRPAPKSLSTVLLAYSPDRSINRGS